MKRPNPIVKWMLTIVLLTACSLLSGCDEDKRLAQMAQENAQRQAAQNEEMARLNREVAEGSKRLVAANAEANNKLLSAQQKLDDQRVQVDAQRQVLADERAEESIFSLPITQRLEHCWCAPYVYSSAGSCFMGCEKNGSKRPRLPGELLVEEIVSKQPTFLPLPPQIAAEDQSSLPAPNAIVDRQARPPS